MSQRGLLVRLGVLGCLAVLMALGAFFARQRLNTSPPLDDYGTIPPFSLIERSGRPFDSVELQGRPWLANFVFTRCMGPCPLLSARMSRLQALLDGPDKPTLVSFSVDPVFDTPEVLSAYALKHKAKPGWFFLTGEPAAIYRLIEGGFRLPVEPVADPSRLAAGELFIHTSRFVLVDRKGHMRAVIDSERPDFFEEVQRLVGLLASSD